ncbi:MULTISPECIES: hypothetical protein [Bacillaceae]|uniref:hypothetical protein n=1 Tax=Bacillaceae TaxID=186817 RepID=UPI0015DD682B|nr:MULTISPECIES: hypothetical protein [Bacillaceae]QNG59821.1 hypothetical protein H4O14_18940 [Bacillus sp. PAMC26568]
MLHKTLLFTVVLFIILLLIVLGINEEETLVPNNLITSAIGGDVHQQQILNI